MAPSPTTASATMHKKRRKGFDLLRTRRGLLAANTKSLCLDCVDRGSKVKKGTESKSTKSTKRRSVEETARLRRRKRLRCDKMLADVRNRVADFQRNVESLLDEIERSSSFDSSTQTKALLVNPSDRVINVDATTLDGFSPVLVAVHNRHYECVLRLLEAEVDASLQTRGGFDIVRWNGMMRRALEDLRPSGGANIARHFEKAWEFEQPKFPEEHEALLSRDAKMHAQRLRWQKEWASQEERISLQAVRLEAQRKVIVLQIGKEAAETLGLNTPLSDASSELVKKLKKGSASSSNKLLRRRSSSDQRSGRLSRRTSSDSRQLSRQSTARGTLSRRSSRNNTSRPTTQQTRLLRRQSTNESRSATSTEIDVARRKFQQKLSEFERYRDAVRDRVNRQRDLLQAAENGPTGRNSLPVCCVLPSSCPALTDVACAGEEGYDAVEIAALAGDRQMIETLIVQGHVEVKSKRPAAIIECVPNCLQCIVPEEALQSHLVLCSVFAATFMIFQSGCSGNGAFLDTRSLDLTPTMPMMPKVPMRN